MKKTLGFGLGLAAAWLIVGGAYAAESTTDLTVTVNIEASCEIEANPQLDFGTVGSSLFTTQVTAQTYVAVVCTPTLPYTIGLDGGDGGTVGNRVMSSGPNTVNYQLFSDAARTIGWGETIGSDTVEGVGTGQWVEHDVYGRVPPQVVPPAGAYTDTVVVIVTY